LIVSNIVFMTLPLPQDIFLIFTTVVLGANEKSSKFRSYPHVFTIFLMLIVILVGTEVECIGIAVQYYD
jgi:hypothetical protein